MYSTLLQVYTVELKKMSKTGLSMSIKFILYVHIKTQPQPANSHIENILNRYTTETAYLMRMG